MARAWPLRGRLSLGALGLSLVLLVGTAWGTGFFYLLARLGYGSPVRLVALDGPHVYAGALAGVVVLGKVARVGLRYRVDGVPGVVPWQRWLSWSALTLYTAVFLSGLLLLLPIRGRPYADLVQLHLLTSIWALPGTAWHAWHYRAYAMPYLRRWRARLPGRRFWAGMAMALAPLPVLVADGPAVSQLPEVFGGASWSPIDGLRGSYLDAIARAPDGTIVAAGDALYVSRDGVIWLRIDVPAATAAATTPETAPPAGHQHGVAAPPNPLVALAVGRSQAWVGSAQGLFVSGFSGPLHQVPFPGGAVRGLAAPASGTSELWATSANGPYLSADGGQAWSRQSAGLARPEGASAVAFLGRDAFVSDGTGVFRWRDGTRAWERTSSAPSVAVLSATANALYASSASTDLQVFRGGRWTDLGLPAPVHVHNGHVHGQPATVASMYGRLYAAGTPDGVSASGDGGWTWTQLGSVGSAGPSQLIGYQGSLWAATGEGLYQFPLATDDGPASGWRGLLLALAMGLGLAAVAVAVLNERRRRRPGVGSRLA